MVRKAGEWVTAHSRLTDSCSTLKGLLNEYVLDTSGYAKVTHLYIYSSTISHLEESSSLTRTLYSFNRR